MTDTPDFLAASPERAVIAVTGAEAKTFLQRVVTNGPEGVSPGRAMASSLLTPQGKILADFIFLDDGEGGVFIDAPASEADMLVKRFTLYRMRADAVIERRDDLGVIVARGSGEAELAAVALAHAPDPRNRDLGRRAIAPAGGPDDQNGAYHGARIAAGVPEFGADYGGGEVFSTDVNHDLLSAIDYRKGCFVGQEVASRMHRKGGVRKRTLRLGFDGEAPAAGATVEAGGVAVGEITSASGALALARVRVDRLGKALADGAAATADGREAAVLDDLSTLAASR